MVEGFRKFFSILWQPASQSGSYIYLSVHALHAPYLRRVLSSWQLMLTHLGLWVGLYLGLGHFSVVEFWFIQGVSDAMLGHAAPRLCWLYLRLTLSNIQAMLSPCCDKSGHVCHAFVQCVFFFGCVVSWLKGGVLVVCQ